MSAEQKPTALEALAKLEAERDAIMDRILSAPAPASSPAVSAEQKQEAVVKPAPDAYQMLKDGKWVECSEFAAKGWGNECSPGTRALYAVADAASSQERIAQLEAQVAKAAKVTEQCAKIADRVANNNRRGTSPEAFAAFTVATEIARYIRGIKPSAALAAPERIVGAAK